MTNSKLTVSCIYVAVVIAFGTAFQSSFSNIIFDLLLPVYVNRFSSPQEPAFTKFNNFTLRGNYSYYLSLDNSSSPIIWKSELIDNLITIFQIPYSIGGIVGACAINYWYETKGLKKGIMKNTILIIIAAILVGVGTVNPTFAGFLIIGRFISGISCALNDGLTLMYLTDISPVLWQRVLGSSYQLFIVLSMIILKIMGNSFFGSDSTWTYIFYISPVVAVLHTILLIFIPDSPTYLMKTGKDDAALRALRWLRESEDVQIEIDLLRKTEFKILTLKDLYFKKEYKHLTFVACALMLFKRIGNMSVIMLSSFHFLQYSRMTESTACMIVVLLFGGFLFFGTLAANLIIKKFDYRKLLLVSWGGMSIISLILFVPIAFMEKGRSPFLAYICVLLVAAFYIFFALGDAIPWIFSLNTFPPTKKPTHVSIVICVYWSSIIWTMITVQPILVWLQTFALILLALMQLGIFVFIFLILKNFNFVNVVEKKPEFKGQQEMKEVSKAPVIKKLKEAEIKKNLKYKKTEKEQEIKVASKAPLITELEDVETEKNLKPKTNEKRKKSN